MMSATCLDPEGDDWGSAAYEGDWVVCDQSIGDGTCTPWGYSSCSGYDVTADTCPLDYGGSGDGCQPPNLITTLINIVLHPGSCDEPMYFGQATIQLFLLLLGVAFLSVPILLLAKPYWLRRIFPSLSSSSDQSASDEELLQSSSAHSVHPSDETEEEVIYPLQLGGQYRTPSTSFV
eukprot:scaffold32535_cov44-Attheya_sp.AAC.4